MPGSFVEHSGLTTERESSESAVTKFNVLETWSRDIAVARDETFNIMHNEDADLSDALKRPVIIDNFTWNMNGNVLGKIDLMKKWIAASEVIQNRIKFYRYLSGTFCVKVTINGSPFMYGKAVMCAQHWPEVSGVGFPPYFWDLELVQMTSLPYVSITPTDSTAGCLELPLLHPNGAVDLTQVSTPIQLVLRSMTPLSAVKDTIDPCVITVWAWMKDYTLSVPTNFSYDPLWEQSGDEYSKPLVSTAATTLASYLGQLKNWPYIGRYARASEIAVSAGGQIAQLFGFSKPSTLKSIEYMQNKPLGNLSNFNGEDTCTKLALDCKQEVTVDPQVTGYGGPDDMVILDIAKREAYLTKFVWRSSYLRGKTLWRSVVNPGLCFRADTTVPGITNPVTYLDPTPLAHVSFPFQYWRGTLKFRFEIIASPFHKGKLRFVYEPVSALESSGSWAFDETKLTSRVVDLATEREFTMHVGWGNNANYLQVGSPMDQQGVTPDAMYTSLDLATLSFQPKKHNGCIGVCVVNPLTCSEANDVEIMVYVSAGDDFELQVPSIGLIGRLNTFSPLAIDPLPNPDPFSRDIFRTLPNEKLTPTPEVSQEQSGEMLVPGVGDVPNVDVAADYVLKDSSSAPVLVDKLAHIHFGERVVSIRQLLKRYCNHTVLVPPTMSNTLCNARWRMNDFPCYPGSENPGLYGTLSGAWNYASPANFLNYFTPAFLMRRGSIRSKYVLYDFAHEATGKPTVVNFMVSRSTDTGYSQSLTPYNTSPLDANFAHPLLYASHLHGLAGAEIAILPLKNTVEVETPYYSAQRWLFAQERAINKGFNDPNGSATDLLRQQSFHTVSVDMDARYGDSEAENTLFIRRYTSAGDDYSLHYYAFPPKLFVVDPLDYPQGGA